MTARGVAEGRFRITNCSASENEMICEPVGESERYHHTFELLGGKIQNSQRGQVSVRTRSFGRGASDISLSKWIDMSTTDTGNRDYSK